MGRLRRATIISCAVGVGLAGALFWTHSQPQPPPPDAEAAAAILGVAADRLIALGDIWGRPTSWGEQRIRTWRLPADGPAHGGIATIADVVVDVDLSLAISAYWYDPARWGRSDGPMVARFGADECRSRAAAFASVHCPYFDATVPPKRVTPGDDGGLPRFAYLWEGGGPGDRENWLNVAVSAVTGEVVEYSFGMRAAQPEATSEARLSPEAAVCIVRAHLPDHVIVERVEVARLWTRTPFAPPGTPVYMVEVEGNIPHEGKPPGWYGCIFGVNATTGEFLSERWEPE